jgi:hypothetical protein
MAKATVLIGSKLPNGVILNHPLDPAVKVEIRGLNGAQKGIDGRPMMVPYVTTEVDGEFWQAWKLGHLQKGKEFKPFSSGAIFEANSPEAAQKVHREREREKTGFEPLSHEAEGVKPAKE